MKKIISLMSVLLLILTACTGSPEKYKEMLVDGRWHWCDTIIPETAGLILLESYHITFVDDNEFMCTIEYAEKEGYREVIQRNSMTVNGWYSYDHPYVRLFSDFFNANGRFDEKAMEVHFSRSDKNVKFNKVMSKLSP